MSLLALLAAGILYGSVSIGPVTPVCRVSTPCSRPARDVVLTFARRGRSISTRTDTRGRYRVALPGGTWTLHASVGMSIRPSRVLVGAGRRHLDLAIDTGIR